MEHTTEAEHDVWRATDALWEEARHALFAKLLANPATRDTVLQINIKGVLDVGDTETALKLARHLSPEALARLTKGGDNEHGSDESDQSNQRAEWRQEEEACDEQNRARTLPTLI